jgi:hypothetical protein
MNNYNKQIFNMIKLTKLNIYDYLISLQQKHLQNLCKYMKYYICYIFYKLTLF